MGGFDKEGYHTILIIIGISSPYSDRESILFRAIQQSQAVVKAIEHCCRCTGGGGAGRPLNDGSGRGHARAQARRSRALWYQGS